MEAQELMDLLRAAFMRGYGAGASAKTREIANGTKTNPSDVWEIAKTDLVTEQAIIRLLKNRER